MGMVFLSLSLITITIACLGIFALVSYAAGQRTKEIGIRKVLGSSVTGIALLLSREFAILIVIANLIAWPLAYLAMSGILSEFAFRVGIGPGTFALTGLIAIALALLSAGFQAIKAAQANPVNTLRHE
jgi:putative ABC transport system permease protein